MKKEKVIPATAPVAEKKLFEHKPTDGNSTVAVALTKEQLKVLVVALEVTSIALHKARFDATKSKAQDYEALARILDFYWKGFPSTAWAIAK